MDTWMEDPYFLAQAGHTLLGILGCVWPYAMFHTMFSAYIGTVVIMVYFGLKETVVDPWYENEPFLWEGVWDCAYGALGLAIGWGSLLLTN